MEALRRHQGLSRSEAAGLLLAARYGERALAWTTADCAWARRIIAKAVGARHSRLRLRLQVEG
jgi:phage gp46-like protein